MRVLILAALLCPLGLPWIAPAVHADGGSSIRGQVALELPGTDLQGLGPVVVYLEPLDAPKVSGRDLPAVKVVQVAASFSPSFQVVTVGQRVDMPNADVIYHNVFSYSHPNEFDLGIYASGESRSIRFEHAGVVKVYCSIHESMNATIVVAPTPHYAVLQPSGRFAIEGVPPGRYRLRTWCEKLPEVVRTVTVEAGVPLSVRLDLTPKAA
jgi:plastocyanin